jgi:hypothetical protein
MALDPSQLTPDQLNSLGWLGTALWGGTPGLAANSPAPYSMASLQDPLGPQQSNDADQIAADAIARRMRRQSPSVPAPDGPEPDDSVFAKGTTSFGSLSPWIPAQSQFAASASPIVAGPGTPPTSSAPPMAPPLPPPQTIKPTPAIFGSLSPASVDSAALPANSQPTSGVIAPPQIAPAPVPQMQPAQQPSDPSLLDKLGAGFANFGAGGRQGGLFGAITGAAQGLSTGQRIDPVGVQNQTAAFFQNKGFDQQTARFIASDPDLVKTLLPQMMGANPKDHVTIKDSLGNEIPLSYDPKSGRYFTADGQPFSAGASGATSAMAAQPVQIDPTTGRDEKFLAALNPLDRAATEGVLNGDMNAQGRNLQKYLPYAQRAEPGFQQQSYFTRLQTQKDFSPQGTSGKNITAINTALGHIDQMENAADGLGNFQTMPALNYPYNAIRGQFSPDYQQKVANFMATSIGSSGELAKAFRSAGMSEADIQNWQKLFNEDSSPSTIKGAADQALHMLDTRLDAVADSYNRGMGVSGNKAGPDLLSPQARAIHNRLIGGNATSPGGSPAGAGTPPTQPTIAEGQTATNPRTGQRLQFHGGQWVPMQ